VKCLFCITELPVDSDTTAVHCPLCGTLYDVKEGQLHTADASANVIDISNIRPLEEGDPIG
jgi:hypothetical protein